MRKCDKEDIENLLLKRRTQVKAWRLAESLHQEGGFFLLCKKHGINAKDIVKRSNRCWIWNIAIISFFVDIFS